MPYKYVFILLMTQTICLTLFAFVVIIMYGIHETEIERDLAFGVSMGFVGNIGVITGILIKSKKDDKTSE